MAISDLLKSEKGIFCGLLVLAGSVLTATGHMSVSEWQTYTTWISGIYVGGKAIQGGAAALSEKKADPTRTLELIDALKEVLAKNDAAANAAVAKLPRGPK